MNRDFDKNYEMNKKGEFILIDEETIASQKGVVKEVIRLFFKNFSITSGFKPFSMPIKLFQASTQSEAYCKSFSNFQYIARAVSAFDLCQTDPLVIRRQRLERIKCLVAFIMAGQVHVTESRKPFNLYLGETLQGRFEDGTRVFFERVKHNLPVDAFYFENEGLGIKFYGSLIFKRKLVVVWIRPGLG